MGACCGKREPITVGEDELEKQIAKAKIDAYNKRMKAAQEKEQRELMAKEDPLSKMNLD